MRFSIEFQEIDDEQRLSGAAPLHERDGRKIPTRELAHLYDKMGDGTMLASIELLRGLLLDKEILLAIDRGLQQSEAKLEPWEVCNRDLPHGAIVIFKHRAEHSPASITDGLSQIMIFHHVLYCQILAHTIIDSIHDFDREWSREDISFDLTQTFLQQVLLERDRRIQQNQPQVESIAPTELPPGETTSVTITGTNLDTVETIDLPDNDLIQIDIIDRTPTQIDAEVTISPQYPPQAITGIRVKDRQGNDYHATPTHPPQVKNTQHLHLNWEREMSELELSLNNH